MRRTDLSLLVLIATCGVGISACADADVHRASAWRIGENGAEPGAAHSVAEADLSGSSNQNGAPNEWAEVRIELTEPKVCVGIELFGWNSAPSCPDMDSGGVEVTDCWRMEEAFYTPGSCDQASSIPEAERVAAEQATGQIDLHFANGSVRAVDYLYLDLRFSGEPERLVVELSDLES